MGSDLKISCFPSPAVATTATPKTVAGVAISTPQSEVLASVACSVDSETFDAAANKATISLNPGPPATDLHNPQELAQPQRYLFAKATIFARAVQSALPALTLEAQTKVVQALLNALAPGGELGAIDKESLGKIAAAIDEHVAAIDVSRPEGVTPESDEGRMQLALAALAEQKHANDFLGLRQANYPEAKVSSATVKALGADLALRVRMLAVFE
jgi:hypothetical protein